MIISKQDTGEFIEVTTVVNAKCSTPIDSTVNAHQNTLTILWFQDNQSAVEIDNVSYHFTQNELLFLTDLHQIKFSRIGSTKIIRFNRAFYCVVDHDREIGCKGLLFYGASILPKIQLTQPQTNLLSRIFNALSKEMTIADHHQLPMLQLLLKQFLIHCIRYYKKTHLSESIKTSHIDTIREFNYLVELHFKNLHTVNDYAQIMNKSSKTLSNVFSQNSNKSPFQILTERKIVEAKRLLCYGNLTVKEVSYELGYKDIQSFSRAFKNYELMSPISFKSKCSGNIAKS